MHMKKKSVGLLFTWRKNKMGYYSYEEKNKKNQMGYYSYEEKSYGLLFIWGKKKKNHMGYFSYEEKHTSYYSCMVFALFIWGNFVK